MKVFRAYGYNVHVKAHEAIFPLFPGQDNPRRVPRNVFDTVYAVIIPVFYMLFIGGAWLVSHVPFLMIVGTLSIPAFACMLVLQKVYMDSTRAMWMLALATTLLLTKTTFGFTFLGFHLETYVYYIAIGASLLALWLRLYNYLCWK